MYKIKLTNNFIIDNLTLNGNNFVSQEELTEDIFRDNLTHIIIENKKNNTFQEYDNVKLVQIQKYNNEWWFILRELTQQEIFNQQIEKTIDNNSAQTTYTAIMTDTLKAANQPMALLELDTISSESPRESLIKDISRWYNECYWTESMVQDMMSKDILTQEEINKILKI